jgi:L,D-transpeptidase catalytic domain
MLIPARPPLRAAAHTPRDRTGSRATALARAALALAAALAFAAAATGVAQAAGAPRAHAALQASGGVPAPAQPGEAPGAGEAPGGSAASGENSQPDAATPGSQPASSTASAETPQRLSNEVTLTTWAHPEERGLIYARADPRSKPVAPIHLYTADGFEEVYMLLASVVDAHGREWVRVRIPGRPNGRTGWVPRELLGEFHETRWRIVVDLATHRMHVYYDGRLRRVFPVGVGKPSTPTPAGHFWIRERFKLANRRNPYWPYALGTSDYSTLSEWPGEGVIGIHGPYGEPQRIPGDPSHGCIRMLTPDIAWLGPRVTLGTPVDVVRG